MKTFIFFLLLLLPIQAEAKTYTISVNSDVITSDNVENAKSQAYDNAKVKASEQVGVYVEATTKVKNLAFDEDLIVSTTASVQKILKKDFSVFTQDNLYNVICHITVEFDDETLEKALDKAKVTAEKEYYKEMNTMNENAAERYKEQSINPTSYTDTELQNLYKQAKVAYNQENYSFAIQYLNQIINVQDTSSKFSVACYELLCTSYAYTGKADEAMRLAYHLLTISPKNYYAYYTMLVCASYDAKYTKDAINIIQYIGKGDSAYKTVRPFMRVNQIDNPKYTWRQIGEYTLLVSVLLCDIEDYDRAYYFCSTRKFTGEPENSNVLFMNEYNENTEDGYDVAKNYVYTAQKYVFAISGIKKDQEKIFDNESFIHPAGYFAKYVYMYNRGKKQLAIQALYDGIELCNQHPTRYDYTFYQKIFIKNLKEDLE